MELTKSLGKRKLMMCERKILRVNLTMSLTCQGCHEPFADWLFHHVHIVTVLAMMLIVTEVSVTRLHTKCRTIP